MSKIILDAITDKVMAHRPSVTPPLKVIAGEPSRPLVIGDIEIPCYVLEDETRVLSQRGVTAGIGLNPEAGFRMPQLMASKAISQFVSSDLGPALNQPIRFKNPYGGGDAYGYPATLLIDICEAVLGARKAKVLSSYQLQIADRCELLLQGFSRVGVVALVDEATGYQDIRARRALTTILERFIADELQPWTKTFPYAFLRTDIPAQGLGERRQGETSPSHRALHERSCL